MTSTIVPRRQPKPYQTARRMREAAVEAGIDPFIAGTTPTDDLRAVIAAAPQLRLVLDVDDVPRLGAHRLDAHIIAANEDAWSDGVDEAASTAYFVARMRGENPDFHTPSLGMDFGGVA